MKMYEPFKGGYYDDYGVDALNGVAPFVVVDSYSDVCPDGVDRDVWRKARGKVSHGYLVPSTGHVFWTNSKNLVRGQLYIYDRNTEYVCIGNVFAQMSEEDKKSFAENLNVFGHLFNLNQDA